MSDTQTRLDAYKAAELKILEGQTVEVGGGQRLSRADLAEVRRTIAQLERKLARENAPADNIKLADFT